jgi:hypothetical protein
VTEDVVDVARAGGEDVDGAHEYLTIVKGGHAPVNSSPRSGGLSHLTWRLRRRSIWV